MKEFQQRRHHLLAVFKAQRFVYVFSIEGSYIVDDIHRRRQTNGPQDRVAADAFVHNHGQGGDIVVKVDKESAGSFLLIVRQENPARCPVVLQGLVALRLALPLLHVGSRWVEASHTWVC